MFLGSGYSSSSLGNREGREAQNLDMSEGWWSWKIPVLGVGEEEKTFVQSECVSTKGLHSIQTTGLHGTSVIIRLTQLSPSGTGLRNSSADVISFLSNSSSH